MSCREFFERLDQEDDVSNRAKAIEDQFPDCFCETESVSRHSGRPVADDEYVFRHIFSPLHLDPNTKAVLPSAFSDVKDKGLSVERTIAFNQHQEIAARGAAMAARKERTLAALVGASSGQIRTMNSEDGVRAFAVYDTALEDNPDHCDVFQQQQRITKSQRDFLRKRLRDIFLQGQINIAI